MKLEGRRGKEGAFNSEAIIKWNMECALSGTFKSAFFIVMECEMALSPVINEFIYVWVEGIHPHTATRLAGLSLFHTCKLLAGGKQRGPRVISLHCTTSCEDQPCNDELIYRMSPQYVQSYGFVRVH